MEAFCPAAELADHRGFGGASAKLGPETAVMV
jgi:hypothetical protein